MRLYFKSLNIIILAFVSACGSASTNWQASLGVEIATSSPNASATPLPNFGVLNQPMGIVADNSGNLYVSDSVANRIRKITSAGLVTTLAGNGVCGQNDGPGTGATFCSPGGITIDGSGTYLYVVGTADQTVRQIKISNGVVATIAGIAFSSGNVDGAGSVVRFNSPRGIVIDSGGGYLYVTDGSGYTIRKVVIATGAVSTIAGVAGSSGSNDQSSGPALNAKFSSPSGIVIDASATFLYVADAANHSIRKIQIASPYAVTTFAGLSGTAGSVDGTGSSARFNSPYALSIDGVNNLYVSEIGNNTIRKITPAGVVTTIAGTAGVTGSADGTGGAASFSAPSGITIDGSANIFVSDTQNNTVRKIVSGTGVTTTFAGFP